MTGQELSALALKATMKIAGVALLNRCSPFGKFVSLPIVSCFH
jgi:hypothetical protein